MTTLATITLKTLRCIKESDRGGTSHSEPYMWPFLATVSNRSFTATPSAAILSDSRKIIKNEMRAGQTAVIDGPANRLIGRYEDDETDRWMLLVTMLLEADDLPLGAASAGYQAYLDELHLRVGQNTFAIKSAWDEGDVATLTELITRIAKRVSDKVQSAIRGALSTGDKIKIGLGWLNLDDPINVAVGMIRPLGGPGTRNLSMHFANPSSGDPRLIVTGWPAHYQLQQFPVEYEIDGTLVVETVQADPCQNRIDAVQAAEAALKGLQHMVQSLQHQLATATPQQKPGIVAEIRHVNEDLIPEAERRIERARRALQFCKLVGGPNMDAPLEPAIA